MYDPKAPVSTPPRVALPNLMNPPAPESPKSPNDRKRQASPCQESPPLRKRALLISPEYLPQSEKREEKDQLDTLFKATKTPVPIKSKVERSRVSGIFTLYGLSGLLNLIEEIKKTPRNKKETPCNENVVRFLMRTNGVLLFAKEGAPSKAHNIPAHYNITGHGYRNAKCWSAGNLFFASSPDNKIVFNRISNKSGDFKPKFDSIKWVLFLLISSKLLSNSMVIEKLYESFEEHTVSLEKLQKEINHVIDPSQQKLLLAANEKIKTVTVEYEDLRAKRKQRRLALSESDEEDGCLQQGKTFTLFSTPNLKKEEPTEKNLRRNLGGLFG